MTIALLSNMHVTHTLFKKKNKKNVNCGVRKKNMLFKTIIPHLQKKKKNI